MRYKPSIKTISRLTIIFLLTLVGILVSGLFTLSVHIDATHPRLSAILAGVASELLASIIFAALYAWMVEKHQIGLVTDEVLQSTESVLKEFECTHTDILRNTANETKALIDSVVHSYYGEISSHFRQVIPENYFAPSDSPDPRFNAANSAALTKSTKYYFKGVTGRHVGIQLEACRRSELDCSVSLLDPRREDLLRLYMRSRFGLIMQGDMIQVRLAEVKNEIYSAIVSLYDLANRCPVEISFHHGPVFYRTEIYDDSMFLSLYIGDHPTPYPPTYLYKRDTFYYDAFLKDFLQAREVSRANVRFDINSDEEELKDFLELTGCSHPELDRLRKMSQSFRDHWMRRIAPQTSATTGYAVGATPGVAVSILSP